VDDRDGVEEPFNGLDWAGKFEVLTDPAECGRLSAGDIGGVCEC